MTEPLKEHGSVGEKRDQAIEIRNVGCGVGAIINVSLEGASVNFGLTNLLNYSRSKLIVPTRWVPTAHC